MTGPDQWSRQQGARGRCHAEDDFSARRAGQIGNLALGLLDLLEDRIGMLQQNSAGLRRLDATRVAPQQ